MNNDKNLTMAQAIDELLKTHGISADANFLAGEYFKLTGRNPPSLLKNIKARKREKVPRSEVRQRVLALVGQGVTREKDIYEALRADRSIALERMPPWATEMVRKELGGGGSKAPLPDLIEQVVTRVDASKLIELIEARRAYESKLKLLTSP